MDLFPRKSKKVTALMKGLRRQKMMNLTLTLANPRKMKNLARDESVSALLQAMGKERNHQGQDSSVQPASVHLPDMALNIISVSTYDPRDSIFYSTNSCNSDRKQSLSKREAEMHRVSTACCRRTIRY